MKILFIIDSLRAGGKERRLIELLKGLKYYQDYECELITLSNIIDYDYVEELDVKIHIFGRNISQDKKIIVKFVKVMKTFKPDIIHCWDNIGCLHFGPIAKIHRIPFLNSSISAAPSRMPIYSKRLWATALTYPFSDIILANSKAGLISYRVPANKGKFIHNGLDMERMKNLDSSAVVKKRYNLKTRYLVGMVASFSDFKDYHAFNEVAEKLLGVRKDITFLGAGDGPNRKIILNRMNPELQEYIIYPGKVSNIESLINLFDIGILLSTNGEGFPNAVMEYMALGKPVIATDAGGTKELIVDKVSGYLVKENNPNEIINKILYLINNPDISTKMGKNGKMRIINEFNIDKMTEKYVGIYEQVSVKTLE
jgi:glycosyltransferase involved in cell wall biosynthesis